MYPEACDEFSDSRIHVGQRWDQELAVRSEAAMPAESQEGLARGDATRPWHVLSIPTVVRNQPQALGRTVG